MIRIEDQEDVEAFRDAKAEIDNEFEEDDEAKRLQTNAEG